MQADDKHIERTKVREHFNRTAAAQPNNNAVLDSGADKQVAFANIYRDYFTKYYLPKLLLPDKQDVVLDFGCGVGRLTYFLSPFVKKIEGVDVAENMINVAKEKLPASSNITFSLLSDLILPVQPQETTKVIAHWVFQHISDEDCMAYFKEFYRVLKPGGKLFLFEQVKNESQHASSIHVFRTVNQYIRLLEAAGFTKVRVKPVMRVPSRGMSLWNKLKINSRILLRLLSLLDELVMNRKPQFAEYYTIFFEFEKRSK